MLPATDLQRLIAEANYKSNRRGKKISRGREKEKKKKKKRRKGKIYKKKGKKGGSHTLKDVLKTT